MSEPKRERWSGPEWDWKKGEIEVLGQVDPVYLEATGKIRIMGPTAAEADALLKKWQETHQGEECYSYRELGWKYPPGNPELTDP